MQRQGSLMVILLIGIFFPVSFVVGATVSNESKYAWSDNLGYVNFANVFVEDTALTGYAWSSNYGWINMNPTQAGVYNNAQGDLSGFAWGEQLGWIDFDGVTINTEGRFSGTAVGSLSGTITFDCDHCLVQSDWLYVASVQNSSRRGGGGNSIRILPNKVTSSPENIIIKDPILLKDEPFVLLPDEAGTFTKDTEQGPLVIHVPKNRLEKKIIFDIKEESQKFYSSSFDSTDFEDAIFFDISARTENGESIHFFESPITIRLPLPKQFEDKDTLSVYWLNEKDSQWVLIPEISFEKNTVVFRVNHLTKFALVQSTKKIPKEHTTLPPNLTVPVTTTSYGQEEVPMKPKETASTLSIGRLPKKYIFEGLIAFGLIFSFFLIRNKKK